MNDNAKNIFLGQSNQFLANIAFDNSHTQGSFMAISGSAGIGKSRLLEEISKRARSNEFRVLESERIEDPSAPAFFSWLLAIRSCLMGYEDSELIQDLGPSIGDVAELIPELYDRFKLTRSKNISNSVTAKYRMFDSVSRFLLSSSIRRPLVLLFDNLHLADQSSLELLEYFVQQIPKYPVTIMATYRTLIPEENSKLESSLKRLAQSTQFSQYTIDGLNHEDVAQLLDVHTKNSIPLPLKGLIHEQSDGNPLFVIEAAKIYCQSLIEKQTSDFNFRFDVPVSLRDVIDARLHSLDSKTKTVLAMASIMGRNFECTALNSLTHLGITDLRSIIKSAEDIDIVKSLETGEYRFKHALFRETLYGQIKRRDKTDYHLAAAMHFEHLWLNGDKSITHQLAHHYFAVSIDGNIKKAVHYNRKAAKVAFKQRAYIEASGFLKQALIAFGIGKIGSHKKEIKILLLLGIAQFRAGQIKDAPVPLLRAANLANNLKAWKLLFKVLANLQFVYGQLGSMHKSCLSLHLTLLDHIPKNDKVTRIQAMASLADAYRLNGKKDLAAQIAFNCMESARNMSDPQVFLRTYYRGCWALGSISSPETLAQRLEISREVLVVAKLHGTSDDLFLVLSAISFYLSSGITSADELNNHLNTCQNLMKSVYHPHYSNLLAGFEISVSILHGKWDKAIRLGLISQKNTHTQEVDGLEGNFGQQMFVIQRARGQLLSTAALFNKIEAEIDPKKLWLPGQILLHCELHNWPKARKLLMELGDINQINSDNDLYLITLVYLSEVCIALNDRARLNQLYKLLKPFKNLLACLPGVVILGAVSGYLASIAALVNKKARAREFFELAIEDNRKVGALPWLAKAQSNYAQFLLDGNNVNDYARAQELINDARAIALEFELNPVINKLDDLTGDVAIQQLSNREHQVLKLIAHGLSNKQISAELFISLSTVATHIRNILKN